MLYRKINDFWWPKRWSFSESLYDYQSLLQKYEPKIASLPP